MPETLYHGYMNQLLIKIHSDYPGKFIGFVGNIIHIFENTHFPYLLYRFMKYDNQYDVYKHYKSHHNYRIY